MRILEILNESGLKFSAMSVSESASVILLTKPYSPYDVGQSKGKTNSGGGKKGGKKGASVSYEQTDSVLFVDAYYEASNALRKCAEQIVLQLNEAGISAKLARLDSYKPLAVYSGLASVGHNNLLFNKYYGSYFALQAVDVQVEIDHSLNEHMQLECFTCGKCSRACPFGALHSGELFVDSCLRKTQGSPKSTTINLLPHHRKVMGNKFLGCDICQSVCPKNAHIKPKQPTPEYKQLFNKQTFISALNSKDKDSLAPYEKYLGKNYLNKEWLKGLIGVSD
ncbi:MAG: hypothetical protein FWB72_02380 [Firmicutes bacterium]|nr:hypothetical protein [Bacillota bacterium]